MVRTLTAGGQSLLGAALLVSGVGMGATIVPVLASPYRGLAARAIPRATSAIRIFQQLAGKGAAAGLDPGVRAAAFASTFWWVLGFTLLAALPALLLPAARPQSAAPGA
ncbi:hypothetical protein [Micromonospora sp. IBSANI012]|uniref:hypothetical protein n=1 Tax=Micromonospora sp. IBSANI012 TaxID=3457761 RepID=UPI0040581B0A